MITDFKLNDVPFQLKEKFDCSKLYSADCRRAGFFIRLASRCRKSEILYWSKNCIVKCFGRPVVWAKLDTKFSNFMCGTSAFLYYNDPGLTRITFQVFGDEVMTMGYFLSFIDLCKQEIGDPQEEAESLISWESEDMIIRCRSGKKNKEAWFNLIAL